MAIKGSGKVNDSLGKAKSAKYDEFYTQYEDIEKEINAYLDFDPSCFRNKVVLLPCDDPEWSNFTKYFAQNFDKLGLKKLISTSYAPDASPRSSTFNSPFSIRRAQNSTRRRHAQMAVSSHSIVTATATRRSTSTTSSGTISRVTATFVAMK